MSGQIMKKKGQLILEYVIILTVIVGVVIFAARDIMQPAVRHLFASAGRVIRDSSAVFKDSTRGDGFGRSVHIPEGSKPVGDKIMNRFAKSAAGKYYSDLIREKEIQVSFLDYDKSGLDPDSSSLWNSAYNSIAVNDRMRNNQESVLALIAHDAVHADYSHNPDKWITSTLERHPELTSADLHILMSPGNSIDQEYNAFKAQVTVWEEVKGDKQDENNDGWSAIMQQGEDDAKAFIRQGYTDQQLPDF